MENINNTDEVICLATTSKPGIFVTAELSIFWKDRIDSVRIQSDVSLEEYVDIVLKDGDRNAVVMTFDRASESAKVTTPDGMKFYENSSDLIDMIKSETPRFHEAMEEILAEHAKHLV